MLRFNTNSSGAPRHPLLRLRIAGLSLALAAVTIVATAGTVLAWDPSAFSPADEQLLFSLTNQDRASAGLNALVNDTYLHQEAEWRAKDMGDRDYFSHQIPPSNNTVFDYMQSDGYCFKVAGENIGLSSYGDDVATNSIEIAFMGSTPHRDNILGTWAHLGVGAYKAANGYKYYDILFSIPCGVVVPTPTPVTTPAPTNGVTDPTRKPAPKPTPAPTVQQVSTIVPTRTPDVFPTHMIGATPTPAETPTPQPSPTAPPALVPAPPTGGPTGAADGSPAVPAPGPVPTAGQGLSLRVRDKPVSQGPIESLFRSLFGGLFGL
ncbi:MAG: CAP domain-containing protein [Candidatus Limnocylindrales bacterium]